MKKILVLLGFLTAGLTAFRSLEPMATLTEEDQKEIQAAVDEKLHAAEDMSVDAIQGEMDRLNKQLKRFKKPSDRGSVQAQIIFAQKKALKDLQTRKYEQSQIGILTFNIDAHLNTDQFTSFKCSDLDKKSQPYIGLSDIGVFRPQNADDFISAVIRKFLQENKKTLNLQSLQSLLENIQLLKPAEEKKEAPKSKAQQKQQDEERKDDSRSHAEDGGGTGAPSKDSKQRAPLPVMMSTQVATWKSGALQEDPESAKLLDTIILDLKNGSNKGSIMNAPYTQRFFDIHIGKRQRLYFAYETINGKRTLLLLFGGPKTDQGADIQSAHAWHMRFLAEQKAKKS
jgi:hypothetical protein